MWSFLVTATPIECMEPSAWIVPDLQRQFDPHVRELFFHGDGEWGTCVEESIAVTNNGRDHQIVEACTCTMHSAPERADAQKNPQHCW
jgi:hypothetical protein